MNIFPMIMKNTTNRKLNEIQWWWLKVKIPRKWKYLKRTMLKKYKFDGETIDIKINVYISIKYYCTYNNTYWKTNIKYINLSPTIILSLFLYVWCCHLLLYSLCFFYVWCFREYFCFNMYDVLKLSMQIFNVID